MQILNLAVTCPFPLVAKPKLSFVKGVKSSLGGPASRNLP